MSFSVKETHHVILCERDAQCHLLCRKHTMSSCVMETHNVILCERDIQRNVIINAQCHSSVEETHAMSLIVKETRNVILCERDVPCHSLCRRHNVILCKRDTQSNVIMNTQCHLCGRDAHNVIVRVGDAQCHSLRRRRAMSFSVKVRAHVCQRFGGEPLAHSLQMEYEKASFVDLATPDQRRSLHMCTQTKRFSMLLRNFGRPHFACVRKRSVFWTGPRQIKKAAGAGGRPLGRGRGGV